MTSINKSYWSQPILATVNTIVEIRSACIVVYMCSRISSLFHCPYLMSPGVSSYGGLARSSPEPPGMYPRPKNLVCGAWEKASYSPAFMLTLCSQGKDSCSSLALRETHIDSFQSGAVQKTKKQNTTVFTTYSVLSQLVIDWKALFHSNSMEKKNLTFRPGQLERRVLILSCESSMTAMTKWP